MSFKGKSAISHIIFFAGLFIFYSYVPVVRAVGQVVLPSAKETTDAPAGNRSPNTISALFLSDFHFDPFHDPGKVQQLVAAPVSEWNAILAAPQSPNQQQAFTSLQQTCHARGIDTPYFLLRSSLHAMRATVPGAKFITVSGDLMAHDFRCRFTTLVPGGTQSDYLTFVEKTLRYLMRTLRSSFPGVPIYAALGNNDTSCGDYQIDAESEFLALTAKTLAEGLPKSQQQKTVFQDLAAGGYYSVPMSAPMHNTRLIVLDDLFMSDKYSTCATTHDDAEAAAQLAWLEKQLGQARHRKQKVWVMGHIPPGIDPYSTFVSQKNVCAGAAPVMFLSSEKLADVLLDYADVVRLGIFGHTHMDELRLLEPKSSDLNTASKGSVAIKMVPSISPVSGNNPSFTVARIDPFSARLLDYKVFEASNQTGIHTVWSKEYSYSQTYHLTSFSPPALKKLIHEFHEDSTAKTEVSQKYLRYYFVGDRSTELRPVWSRYVCALSHPTAQGFATCVCSSTQ